MNQLPKELSRGLMAKGFEYEQITEDGTLFTHQKTTTQLKIDQHNGGYHVAVVIDGRVIHQKQIDTYNMEALASWCAHMAHIANIELSYF